MSIEVGTVEVPIFARLYGQDYRLGELEVQVTATAEEDENGGLTLTLDGAALEQEITEKFNGIEPTRQVGDDYTATGEADRPSWEKP